MIRVEVKKNENETTANLIRRFTKRVQSSSIIQQAKGGRYWERPQSEYVKKKSALKRLAKKEYYEKMKKLGKISDVYYKKSR
jgi:ribosomal protein S21